MMCSRHLFYTPIDKTSAEGYLVDRKIDHAMRLAESILELTREREEHSAEAQVLHLMGEIASHCTPPEVAKAEHHYRPGLALAIELGMRPLVAHCHLGLGRLYHRTGNRQEAQENLATARTMYREMGMTYWMEQVEAEATQPS